MIWLINVDDQWEFSNSCIKFALAGWFVSSHVLEVERHFWGPHHVEARCRSHLVCALLVLLVRQHVTELLQFSTSSFQFREAPAWLMRPVFGDEPTQQQSIGLYQICMLHATIFFAPFAFLAFGSVEGSRGSSFCVVYSVTFEHVWTLNWNRSYQAHTLNLL